MQVQNKKALAARSQIKNLHAEEQSVRDPNNSATNADAGRSVVRRRLANSNTFPPYGVVKQTTLEFIERKASASTTSDEGERNNEQEVNPPMAPAVAPVPINREGAILIRGAHPSVPGILRSNVQNFMQNMRQAFIVSYHDMKEQELSDDAAGRYATLAVILPGSFIIATFLMSSFSEVALHCTSHIVAPLTKMNLQLGFISESVTAMATAIQNGAEKMSNALIEITR